MSIPRRRGRLGLGEGVMSSRPPADSHVGRESARLIDLVYHDWLSVRTWAHLRASVRFHWNIIFDGVPTGVEEVGFPGVLLPLHAHAATTHCDLPGAHTNRT